MSFLKFSFYWFILLIAFVYNPIFAQENDSLKQVSYTYENGQVSSEGTLRNGKPDGYWKSYYRNGNLRSEGNRKNYLLDGLWKFYTEDGILYLTIDYTEDLKDGYRTTFKGSRVYKKEAFKEDQRNGLTEIFYNNGAIKQQTPFVNGREKGLGYSYDTTGRVTTLSTYKAGVLVKEQRINRYDEQGNKSGLWMDFHTNREKKNEGIYVNDLKHGYWKYYKPDGNLIRIEKWVNGVLIKDADELAKIEIKREIDPTTGRIKKMGGYRNGKKEGVHREYDENGNVIGSEVYSNDILLAEGIYDEQGRRQGLWKFYYLNGEIKEQGKYKDDKRIGTWRYFFEDGEIEQIGDFANDLPEGTWRWYYPNKEIRLEEEYAFGYEDGLSTEYADTGTVIAQGQYIDGYKEGVWEYRIGNLREKGKYFEGEKQGQWQQYYVDTDKLAFEGEYLNGIENGIHRYYHPNGKVKRRGKYKLGLRDGIWEFLDEYGNITLTIKYDQGKEIEYNGEKISYGKRVDRQLETEEQNREVQQ
jgi:antitoxin component YwqK of YwqJK toxin-antitoxin module